MSGEWRNRPMVGFDLETTGVDVETARIVTACIGLTGGPNRWTARNWLLRQEQPIPAEATAIHGITTDYANQHGQNAPEAIGEIRDDLYRAWEHGMPVVGHNVIYDLTVLDRELRRHQLGSLDVRGIVLDTLVLDKHQSRRRGSRRLIDVAKFYGITLTEQDAHGAEQDALTACRIAWKLGASWVHLQAIHDLQIAAYREQRLSFAAYLARKGEQLDDPNTDWPLKPVPAAVQHALDLEPAPF